MKFSYDNPLVYTVGAVHVVRVKHGVTEIVLSNGQLMRLTVHVDGVQANPEASDKLDVLYNVIVETMENSDVPIMDVHETMQ